MFSGIPITRSTKSFSEQIDRLREALGSADAVVVGAGAGLSAAAGFDYAGERFRRYFSDFGEKYGFGDMYSGGFYPYKTPEEYWAWWSRHILINRYTSGIGEPYRKLLELVRDRDYFVLTTNVDHQFQLAGFDKKRLFCTQGDYGLFQCSIPCGIDTYGNEEIIRRMVREQRDMKIPTELIPKCPVCGAPLTMNLRCDDRFVEDAGWLAAASEYEAFLRTRHGRRILFLELGVGYNTPAIIKYPFWQMTAANKDAVYACVNRGEALCPEQIEERSVCIDGDIAVVLDALH